MTWPRRLTMAAGGTTAIVLLAAMALVVLAPSVGSVIGLVAGVPLAGVPIGAGVLIARKDGTGLLGPLVALPGLVVALGACAVLSSRVAVVSHAGPPGQDYLTAASQGAWVLIYVFVAVPLLCFPTGRPGSRVAWGLLGLIVADAALFMVTAATAPGPFLPPDQSAPHVFGQLPSAVSGTLTAISLPGLLLTLVTLTVHLVRRYRTGDSHRRRQFRWLSLVGAMLPGTLVATWLSYALTGTGVVVLSIGLSITYLALPVLIAIAVLRPDLFDVDRVLAATAAHAAFTMVLLAVFGAIDLVVGLFVARNAPTVAVAATAVVAVMLAPGRRRMQTQVDRWFYPVRKAAYSAIDTLHRDTIASHARPEELQARLREALGDRQLTVTYRTPSDHSLVDADGRAPTEAPTGPHANITMSGESIGLIVASHTFSVELLHDIAARAAPLAELVRLRIDLGNALREVEDSRSRILRAGYDERVRLERDLHDGAQQRLVSLGMALRLAQRRLPRGGEDVSAVLDAAVAELGTAVGELRQLAHGIRPSCLDDGLIPALSGLVSSAPLPITLQVEEAELDSALETTAYYVAAEAITNAVRHSDAQNIALDVAVTDGVLRVRISDDGAGVAAPREGSGLAGLTDRVGAHGGQLLISTGRGRGTTIEAVLPCASS